MDATTLVSMQLVQASWFSQVGCDSRELRSLWTRTVLTRSLSSVRYVHHQFHALAIWHMLTYFLKFLSAVPQVIFQVLAPKFSETWFDLKGRTTATMLMSICGCSYFLYVPAPSFRFVPSPISLFENWARYLNGPLINLYIANPVGTALGQLISPMITNTRSSVRGVFNANCHAFQLTFGF